MVRLATPFVLASLSVTALAAQSCSTSSQCKDEKYPCCSREYHCDIFYARRVLIN